MSRGELFVGRNEVETAKEDERAENQILGKMVIDASEVEAKEAEKDLLDLMFTTAEQQRLQEECFEKINLEAIDERTERFAEKVTSGKIYNLLMGLKENREEGLQEVIEYYRELFGFEYDEQPEVEFSTDLRSDEDAFERGRCRYQVGDERSQILVNDALTIPENNTKCGA